MSLCVCGSGRGVHRLTVGGCGVGSKYNCTSGQVRTGHHAGPPSGPPGVLSWSTIDKTVVNSTAHQTVAYDAALQSMVLLKQNGVLPLKTGTNIAVVGPGVRQMLESFRLTGISKRCCVPTLERDTYPHRFYASAWYGILRELRSKVW